MNCKRLVTEQVNSEKRSYVNEIWETAVEAVSFLCTRDAYFYNGKNHEGTGVGLEENYIG